MSVNPGFGGQAFIPGTLDKLKEARKMIDESGFDITLEIDGGVTTKNIKEIAEAGADMFVAGSAIFNSASMPLLSRSPFYPSGDRWWLPSRLR